MASLKQRVRRLGRLVYPDVTNIFYLNCLPDDNYHLLTREVIDGVDWLLVSQNEDNTYRVFVEPPERHYFFKGSK